MTPRESGLAKILKATLGLALHNETHMDVMRLATTGGMEPPLDLESPRALMGRLAAAITVAVESSPCRRSLRDLEFSSAISLLTPINEDGGNSDMLTCSLWFEFRDSSKAITLCLLLLSNASTEFKKYPRDFLHMHIFSINL